MSKIGRLSVQKVGRDFAIRIPEALVKKANLFAGQPVDLIAEHSSVVIRSVGARVLTLEQKLALFDPEKHNG